MYNLTILIFVLLFYYLFIKSVYKLFFFNLQTSGYLNLLANCIDNFTHGLAVAGSFLVSKKVRANQPSWDVAFVHRYCQPNFFLSNSNVECFNFFM